MHGPVVIDPQSPNSAGDKITIDISTLQGGELTACINITACDGLSK